MPESNCLRPKVRSIIFQSDTPAGKLFDIILIIAILLSVVTVLLDSIASISSEYGLYLHVAEWFFTVVFSAEYLLRLYSAEDRVKYAVSFFGIIDLFAVLPTYLSLLVPQGRFLLTIRVVRLLRVFRVLKLAEFVGQQNVLGRALWASRHKIIVFILSVFTIVVIVGSLMYVIEGEKAGFTSIPVGIYWAVVTLTTVGYGDVTPQSPFGQFLAAVVMVLGYGIIAVPTGIVTVELGRASRKSVVYSCPYCGIREHEYDALFCKSCGAKIIKK